MTSLDSMAREIAVLSRSGYPLVYVLTHEEERAQKLVQAAAQAGRKQLVKWTSSQGLQTGGDRLSTLDPKAALTALDAHADPSLFLFLDLHPHLLDPAVIRALRDRLGPLTAKRQSVVILSPVLQLPAELERDAAVLDLPLPTVKELQEELARVAQLERVEVEPEAADRAVRSALGLSLNEAGRVFRKVMVLRRGLSEDDLKMVVEEKKRALRTSEALEFHELGESLADVGGLSELKRWLGARTRAFGAEARSFGLPPPKGLLLLGVQGCGKSLSAKAVAELWKFPLLRLDLSSVFSGSERSPEATIRQAVKVSESLAPVVLWVDEIEKGFSQVTGSESGSRVFGSFITWLAEKQAEVFVVATANEVAQLPPELLRRGRFDEVFFVDLPNVQERLDILKIHLKKRARDPARFESLPGLAQRAEHFSGAELEQVVVSGLYRAFSQNRDLTDEDLDLALKQTVPLYATYEERIKELRDWARRRARPATQDASVLDLFESR